MPRPGCIQPVYLRDYVISILSNRELAANTVQEPTLRASSFAPNILILSTFSTSSHQLSSWAISMQDARDAQLPPILRLPPAVRRCIYRHFHPALGHLHFQFRLHGQNDREFLGFYSLLLSCRTIYEEVSELLYSTNIFEISYKSAGSLRPMRNLRDASLSSLRDLKVVLNEASCHHEECFECCEDLLGHRLSGAPFNVCHELHTDWHWHSEALRPLEDSAIALFDEWTMTANYLWSRITPENLRFSLVCDFDPEHENTPSAARLIVAPLINLSPLKGCHVRLGRTPHQELNQIAREAVLRVLGIVGCAEPTLAPNITAVDAASKFLRLPREIRFRILEYTDLITPCREVRWSRERKGYLPTLIDCQWRDANECPAQLHSGCKFRRCWDGTGPLRGFVDPSPQVGCFCRLRHAAFSLNCHCWGPPTNLFLVCRTLYRDAQAVLFTGNRFVVHDYKSETPHDTPGMPLYPYDRFAISDFLRGVVPSDCLHLLRSLEVTFPPYNQEWPQEGCPALRDWVETVRFIKEKMNLEGLTIRLTMYGAPIADYAGAREDMTMPDARDVMQAYARILGPMNGLGDEGLKRFYAEITLPERFTSWFRDKDSTVEHFTIRITKEEQQLKERAEQLVMGSRYAKQPEDACYWDGVSREPIDSAWRRKFVIRY